MPARTLPQALASALAALSLSQQCFAATAFVRPGLVFAIENPALGVAEADELDHSRILDICLPYLGEMAGVYSDWTPLQGRATLFPETLDAHEPWQFVNFRVV